MRGKWPPRIVSATLSVIGGGWTAATKFLTVATLPSDAAAVWKSIVSAPEYLPIGITAVSFAALLWSFWPDARTPKKLTSVDTSGPARFQALQALKRKHPALRIGLGEEEEPEQAFYRAPASRSSFGVPLPTPKPFVPRRDVGLADAVSYLRLGEWGRVQELGADIITSDDQITEILRDLEQAARDGEVNVWGRNAPYDDANNWHTTQEPIPAEHWTRHWIDTGSLRGKPKTAMRQPWKSDNERFYDLMVCKRQIERRWPRGRS